AYRIGNSAIVGSVIPTQQSNVDDLCVYRDAFPGVGIENPVIEPDMSVGLALFLSHATSPWLATCRIWTCTAHCSCRICSSTMAEGTHLPKIRLASFRYGLSRKFWVGSPAIVSIRLLRLVMGNRNNIIVFQLLVPNDLPAGTTAGFVAAIRGVPVLAYTP